MGGASSPEKLGATSLEANSPALAMAQSLRFQHQLSLIEEIRGDLQEEGVTVPGVVVCGDQSAGQPTTEGWPESC
jgi:hypothetical protein